MKQRVRIQLLEGKKRFNTDGWYDDETGELESPFPGQIIKVWNDAGQLLLIQPVGQQSKSPASTELKPQQPAPAK